MQNLHELMARYAQDGRLMWIGLRPKRRADLTTPDRADVSGRGLIGDHGASEKRAITLVQAEHLAVIGAMLGGPAVAAQDLRRNLVVAGINLFALKHRRLQIGSVVLDITGPCAPCSRMEETLGHGGYSAVRGHGGWYARVIAPGSLAVGDKVTPL